MVDTVGKKYCDCLILKKFRDERSRQLESVSVRKSEYRYSENDDDWESRFQSDEIAI